MKLELLNGFSLSLWENEVEQIYLQESHIDIVRPTGRTLRISFSNFWRKTSPSAISMPTPLPPIKSSNEDRKSKLSLTQEPSRTINAVASASLPSFQELLNELHDSINRLNVASDENKTLLDAIQKKENDHYSELNTKIEQIESHTKEELKQVESKAKSIELDYQHIVSELGEVCSWLHRGMQMKNQRSSRKRKEENKSNLKLIKKRRSRQLAVGS